jgi:rhodanese-related sulfurtransferase
MEPEGKGSVSPEQARRMLASNEASAIDIRDDETWVGGHIPGARHCSQEELEQTLEEIDSSQTVIVACEDGNRSAEVAEQIAAEGREAVSLEGGMASWRSDDQPMQPSEDPNEGTPI